MKKIAFNQIVSSATMAAICSIAICFTSSLAGQDVRCDPTKVISAEACAKCHVNEAQTWKQTPHFRTFEELGRRPEAKEICSKMGLRSVKRSDVCIDCHFTMRESKGRNKPVSGISCESCHGAAKEWVGLHNDYGGPLATKESESVEHATLRLNRSTEAGMKNTRNLYMIASSCFGCHTVPNEELVNIGGHKAGTDEFELVSWSQGQVRHNFLRTGNQSNAASDPERLRVMFVVGLIADLEFSTRATAKASQKSKYGIAVASRAAKASLKLYELQQQIQDPNVERALRAFAGAELRVNNSEALLAVAKAIRSAGKAFGNNADGKSLAKIDSMLPSPTTYK